MNAAPLRLRWGNGLGAAGFAIGAPFLLLGVVFFVGAFKDVAARGVGSVPILVWPLSAAFTLVGAVMALGSGGVTIDRDRREVRSWIGLMFVPLWIDRLPLAPDASASVRPKVRPNGKPGGHALWLTLPDGREAELSTFEDPLDAEGLRLRIAEYLGSRAETVAGDAEIQASICPSCGAPVPPSNAGSVICGHCGASVDVPASVRAAHVPTAEEARERRRAQAIFDAIGQEPGTLERAMANAPLAFLVPLLPLTLLVYGLILGNVVGDATAALAPTFGADLSELGWAYPIAFCLAAFPAGAFLRPVLRVRRAKAFAPVRLKIAAMLLARPPELEGGRGACRSCGAPLEAATGVTHERCAYCGAHNLITPPLALQQALRALARVESADLGDAERELASARVLVAKSRRLPTIVALVFVALATFLVGMMASPAVDFHDRLAGQRYAEARVTTCPDLPAGKPTSLTSSGTRTCAHRMPLRRGWTTTLSIATGTTPPRVRVKHRGAGWDVAWQVRNAAQEASFTAPFDGWFTIETTIELGAPTPVVTWSQVER